MQKWNAFSESLKVKTPLQEQSSQLLFFSTHCLDKTTPENLMGRHYNISLKQKINKNNVA